MVMILIIMNTVIIMKYDFGGYATRNNLKCTDGRTIRQNAFKHNDGSYVPLVWQHSYNDPNNILGKAKLENRTDGVYAYCYLNDTENSNNVRELIRHGDIDSLSIHANNLIQNGGDVLHGDIKEVSLVLSGANPGAFIDDISFSHSDSDESKEAIIYSGTVLTHSILEKEEDMTITHADNNQSADNGKTVEEIYNTLNEDQVNLLYFLIDQVVNEKVQEMSQSEFEDDYMSRNVFDNNNTGVSELTHDEFSAILNDAKKIGSFKEAFLNHAETYGITGIDVLFPDAKNVESNPALLSRRMEWVGKVLNGTHHSPFSRIKSTIADITADEARALGYVKGNKKKEEIIKMLKRVTTPTTIYKKQKLDRDDIVDITDLDVVAFIKSEMRMMLDEEIARAVLIGDGRDAESQDKINEEHIRPIFKDVDMYVNRVNLESTATLEELEDAIIRSRNEYHGTGKPSFYAAPNLITSMLLMKDKDGRRLYKTLEELAATLQVSEIIEVPVMANVQTDDKSKNLMGIIVNLNDYTIGADKGGNVNMFDDFDIDYNQYKYLIESRLSGALIKPKSAIIIQKSVA